MALKVYRFEAEQWLPRPLEEVFAFFSDARNLEAITPPWLQFHVLTPQPIMMGAGTLIDYRLRVRGLPLRWQSEITAWEAPRRFIDEQRRGPYRQWLHEHLFAERDGGTLVRDRIDYAVPGGPLAPLLHRWWVGPDVQTIFAFRHRQLEERFGKPADLQALTQPG